MRLGGRVAGAAEVLADMAARHRPASEALRDWGLSHRFAGAGDRSVIGNLVHDALRRRRSLAWRMEDEAPLAAVLGVLLTQWGLTPERLAQSLAGDRFAPPLPAPDALSTALARDLTDAPAAIRADVPDWVVPHLEAAFGDGWLAEAEAFATRAPLDLRVNTLKAAREAVAGELAAFHPEPVALAPEALRITAPSGEGRLPNVEVEPAFQRGQFEVQDAGSQVAARLVGAEPGEQVLDLCAGGGGKTLALAALMDNRGQIHATDSDRTRLAPIFARLERAGSRNAQVHSARADLSALTGAMDRVLVDAPCTGSGTWRRKPDAKWRLREAQLARRMAEQDAVLDQAAPFVRPGGRLTYVTCSLFPEENGARVAAFLARQPDFTRVDAGPEAADLPRTAEGDVALTPLRTSTDGFFIASLERAG